MYPQRIAASDSVPNPAMCKILSDTCVPQKFPFVGFGETCQTDAVLWDCPALSSTGTISKHRLKRQPAYKSADRKTQDKQDNESCRLYIRSSQIQERNINYCILEIEISTAYIATYFHAVQTCEICVLKMITAETVLTSDSWVPLQANVATDVSGFQATATFVLVLSAVTVTEPLPRLAPLL